MIDWKALKSKKRMLKSKKQKLIQFLKTSASYMLPLTHSHSLTLSLSLKCQIDSTKEKGKKQ